ncbi:fumarylacetoacetate hydrolase family protein [Zeimonas arvi]|uniref:Fumarylacetoacetase-like C-terminal domain-containing protein n=1 Tax=Zeimonas arvi TaxID=2498847 RepID=A0A5C8P5Y1_9BURK|nr:fumarylacetoacetate hydrolase family protein [Zeimonas arvi]TXL68645.1 hypothetical protein FHP08_02900 [Zeimonas arvi]
MKLISFEHSGRASFGAVVETAVDGSAPPAGWHAEAAVVDLGARLPRYADLRAGDLTLCRPIPFPEKIVCVGIDYAERNEAYQDVSERPKYPSLFMRAPDSLVAHGATILRPPESAQLDYGGEIAIVIGKGARFDPPRWLVPGDTIEVEVDGIGMPSNAVGDEAA